jgi:hypothetical protein
VSYRPPLCKEERFGNVTLHLLGGEAPVFSTPRAFLGDINDYEKVEVVLLLNGAHRVTPNDLDIPGFPQWDEYAQFPSGGFIDWPTIDELRAELRKRVEWDNNGIS